MAFRYEKFLLQLLSRFRQISNLSAKKLLAYALGSPLHLTAEEERHPWSHDIGR
jgi:hypothetical protein